MDKKDESAPDGNTPSSPRFSGGNLPIRDMGSFVYKSSPSDAELADHRSGGAVYLGLHVPKVPRHRRKKRSRHNQHATIPESENQFRDAQSPGQRVQNLLGTEEDDEEHKTHDMFCEMLELTEKQNGELEWKETARWVKFEEDVEEGGERWSKPHVATLSLHSLFELRCNILQGTIILDMEADSLTTIIDILTERMVESKQLEENLLTDVREVLLLRHQHLHEKIHRQGNENGGSKYHLPLIRSLADIGKKYSEPRNMHHELDQTSIIMKRCPHLADHHAAEGLSPPSLHQPSPSALEVPGEANLGGHKSTPNFHKTPSKPLLDHNNTTAGSLTAAEMESAASSHKLNMHFMKKIPPGSEAANILIGEVDFLNHPIVGFIRLLHSKFYGDLTEVPVPTKFIFFLLGPKGMEGKYHEIGRSIATLMSDEVFHDVAYHARTREDLLTGIDEFLDQVTVLPPGEWDPSIRISPPQSVPSQETRKLPHNKSIILNGKATDGEEGEGGEHESADPCLQRTGRLFGGLIDDVKRKLPWYKSDFKDALHVQSIASIVFLYFACLTPIITFGGLLGDATKNNMAAFESILAGAVCGITYALCAGQPLTILGSTGPVLVFETIAFQFCHDNKLNYLEMRFWIGLWTGVILIVMTAFDLSALVRYITRFTEESFALLISLIFIKEAFAKLIHISDEYPINFNPDDTHSILCHCEPPANHSHVNFMSNFTSLVNLTYNATHELTAEEAFKKLTKAECLEAGGVLIGGCRVFYADVFFLSVILFTGTFTISYALKATKTASFFPTSVRSYLSDFAVLIAILSMVGMDAIIGLDTPKLKVPHTFGPTNPNRPWIINPMGSNPWWTALAAVIPALLATILIFMDQQITAVIVNRKENKLQKSKGYHLDLFIVAILIIVNSLLGLPWFVAATVLSINHVMSLKKESDCTAPGERPKFLGVREQRVTGFVIFLLIGLSVLFTKILMSIPMPVLYGVFLYMGVSSLRGMQVVNRVLLWFKPQKYQPDFMFLRHVRTRRVHIFTVIQIVCLVVLWVIKTIKVISIAFPIMVLAMCFVRKGMDWIFTQNELKWLDDIMPESHKRQKEDERKKKEEANDAELTALIDDKDQGGIPMGGIMKIPVQGSTVNMDMDTVNISEEMAKTSLWKTIVANESSSNLLEHGSSQSNQSSGHRHRKSDRSKKKKKPVAFFIDEEDEGKEKKNAELASPKITLDPPSDASGNKNDSDPEA